MDQALILPFYQTSDKYIVRTSGCYLFDEQGKKYIDFESGVWCSNLGHCNESVNSIIRKQSDDAIHVGMKFQGRLPERLSDALLQCLGMEGGKSTFLTSGSEAVNLAISMAKKITGRNKVIKLDYSFLSALGQGAISETNKDLINIVAEDFSAIAKLNYREIAGFVLEPGTSSGFVHFPSPEFLDALIGEIRKNESLIIVDEVTTGFGRTGKWFGFQHYSFTPDIVATGKGLGNGYPVSAVSVNKKIAELFDNHYFRYAQSHQNDPLGCAVGAEVIRLLTELKLVERSNEIGDYFKAQLLKVQINHAAKVKEVRGRGLMLAIEFFPEVDVEKLNDSLFDQGFVVGFKEKVLRFMPPLIIDKSDVDNVIDAMESLL
jgi:acetylornithine aminotransferase